MANHKAQRLLGMNGRPPEAPRSGLTVADLQDLARFAGRTAAVEAMGPLAELFTEFMERQAQLEDSLWYCPDCGAAKCIRRVGPLFVPPKCVICPLRAHVIGGFRADMPGPQMVQYAYVAKGDSTAPVDSVTVTDKSPETRQSIEASDIQSASIATPEDEE